MSKPANSIRKGLKEAVAYAKGRGAKKGYRVHVPEHVDVKAIRTKLGMTHSGCGRPSWSCGAPGPAAPASMPGESPQCARWLRQTQPVDDTPGIASCGNMTPARCPATFARPFSRWHVSRSS